MIVNAELPETVATAKALVARQLAEASRTIAKSLGDHAAALDSLTAMTNDIAESARRVRQASEDLEKLNYSVRNAGQAELNPQLIEIVKTATGSLVLPTIAKRVLESVAFHTQDGGIRNHEAAAVLHVVATLLGGPSLVFVHDPLEPSVNRDILLALSEMQAVRQAVAAYPELAAMLPSAEVLAAAAKADQPVASPDELLAVR